MYFLSLSSYRDIFEDKNIESDFYQDTRVKTLLLKSMFGYFYYHEYS